jgi:hypothetical protein
VDHEKIEWLRKQIIELKKGPTNFPRERPEIRDRSRRDRILELTNQAPDKKADYAYYMVKTGWTLDAVKNLVRRLRGDQELIDIAPGLFTLPGLGVAHIPTHEAIMAWVDCQPAGTEVKAVQLAKLLGRKLTAINGAIHGHGALVADGKLRLVRRGVFVRGDCTPAARPARRREPARIMIVKALARRRRLTRMKLLELGAAAGHTPRAIDAAIFVLVPDEIRREQRGVFARAPGAR